jgi:hypothetical protein
MIAGILCRFAMNLSTAARSAGVTRVAVRLSIRLSVLALLVLGLPCGGAVI